MMRILFSVAFLIALSKHATSGEDAAVAEITQPAQPETGPGGREYKHKSSMQIQLGKGDSQVWIFEPADPQPEKAPVVFFLHGWSAMEPGPYRAWIDHLAKRGNVVIYPRYQANIATLPHLFTPNAIGAIKDALKFLDKKGRVKPDLARVAATGHSYGGVIAANLAALAKDEGLPTVKALLLCEPGTNNFGKPYADYSKIPAGTLLISMAGEDDKFVKDTDAKRIFKESTQIAKADKNYIILHTDSRGKPAQNSGHLAPLAPSGFVDAHDYYGFWKWFDALMDAAYENKNREYALGNTEKQRFLGKWSDGTPVKEATVLLEAP